MGGGVLGQQEHITDSLKYLIHQKLHLLTVPLTNLLA